MPMEDMRRAFEVLPKSKYWRRTSQFSHPEATPERIILTLGFPDMPIEHQDKGRTAYRKYLPDEGIWLRVVFDQQGALFNAFKDSDEMRKRGML